MRKNGFDLRKNKKIPIVIKRKINVIPICITRFILLMTKCGNCIALTNSFYGIL